MKRKQIGEYRPRYPKKLIKGAALAAAAMLAIGATGCESLRTGGEPMPEPTDELVLDGEVAIDPGEDELELGGEPLPDETYDAEENPEGAGREGPALEGKIVVPEENP